MLMFTLVISHLTTSNLPWFMDLTEPWMWGISSQLLLLTLDIGYLLSATHRPSTVQPPGNVQGRASRFAYLLWTGGCFCLVAKSYPTLVQPHELKPTRLLSMGFPRQEYWSELPFPSPGDLPNPGIKPAFPALAGGFSTTEPPGKPWIGGSKITNTIEHRNSLLW